MTSFNSSIHELTSLMKHILIITIIESLLCQDRKPLTTEPVHDGKVTELASKAMKKKESEEDMRNVLEVHWFVVDVLDRNKNTIQYPPICYNICV